MKTLDPQEVLRASVLEFRGDGKAGGGLVLAFQSLANLMLTDPETHVQEWPFFSSARRGAGIRSFLRVSRKPIMAACEVTRPHISLLMDEAAAQLVDFAQGVPAGGTFVINTPRSPEECARHFKLSGRVMTIAGDDLGRKYLKHPIGNVAAYVAVAQAVGGLERQTVIEAFLKMLKKRRIPQLLLDRNREALEASFGSIQTGTYECAAPSDHAPIRFTGYGDLPIGAQTALRLSQNNKTAGYARSGLRLRFEDPAMACTGCSHCVTNCPEGIILWEKDDAKGMQVTGVDVSNFCKLCGECIEVCPEHLFKEVPFSEEWEEVLVK
ncbi:MAG: 2-oxoacid:acceptor oxidoreductase family protein [Candidatus Eisenbacteria bacterium]|nr:2-oxoacid:acceptor oxidoreductase family protein [Candidatus Eisenbacteria bacterium]